MLIAFRFKNFKSFAGEGELSLLSHRADKTLPNCLLSASKGLKLPSKILPVIAIYGANSAGKTNVIIAFDYLRQAITESQGEWRPGSGTQIDRYSSKAGVAKPAVIEADFIIQGKKYNYGVAANSKYFEEEWLYSFSNGKEILEFYRRTKVDSDKNYTTNIQYGPNFSKNPIYEESIVIKTRENSLFLSAAAQDNHVECTAIYKWFKDDVSSFGISVMPDRANAMLTADLLEKIDDKNFKKQIISLLRTIEPQLIDIVIEKNVNEIFPESFKDVMNKDVLSALQNVFKYNIKFIFRVRKSKISMPYAKQSKGFQKFFGMCVYIIFGLETGELLLVDELESSIHPHVAKLVVEMFQNKDTNTAGGQLVFTTHDTNMLDQALLRRDQIWFVEKTDLESKLYSLLEFSPRKDENLERGYLRGRYGAIPALGLDLSVINPSAFEAQD